MDVNIVDAAFTPRESGVVDEISYSHTSQNFHHLSVLVLVWELIWTEDPSISSRCSGGPGLETPPDRVVSTEPYAYTRNPMYLGHLIYLLGFSLTLRSWLGAVITVAVALRFHRRAIGDEEKLATRLGKPYIEYMNKVPRWI